MLISVKCTRCICTLANRDVLLWNVSITGYVDHDPTEFFCGLFGEAQEIFSKLQFRDTGMWNTMILGKKKTSLEYLFINNSKTFIHEREIPSTYVGVHKMTRSSKGIGNE